MDHSKHLCGAACYAERANQGVPLFAAQQDQSKQPDDTLTFAQAMAIPADELQAFVGGMWCHVDGDTTIGFLRTAKFRRSRPKRSRVEEMAGVGDGKVHYGVDVGKRGEFGAAVVRAVCKYAVENEVPGLAERIERYFLERK